MIKETVREIAVVRPVQSVLKAARIIKGGLNDVLYFRRPDSILWQRAAEDSADYIEQHLASSMLFPSAPLSPLIWDYAIRQIASRKDGLALEFGVFRGTSINYFAKRLPQLSFYGFDSFEGLADDWLGSHYGKGVFNIRGKLPKVPGNVSLLKGWFDKTLPSFVTGTLRDQDLTLLHIDSDTCEAAKIVLTELESYIKPGLFVLFDEYLGYPNWRNGEFRAWQEFCKARDLRYRYRAFSGQQALVEVL